MLQVNIQGYMVLTSTKATVSSMASGVAPCTVVTEASRCRRLTVVSGSKAAREPDNREKKRFEVGDFMKPQKEFRIFFQDVNKINTKKTITCF